MTIPNQAPLTSGKFKRRVLQHINYTLGTHSEEASKEAWWRATCLAVNLHPRVFIFGAKAAPGYYLAKEIIYAINKVGEKLIPAADVSEQISTAGKEASGTGNMKLALNGALTIGTLDGANIEMAEAVGEDNTFIFGNTVDAVKALDKHGYQSSHYDKQNSEIKACLDWLDTNYFTVGSPGELSAIKRSLLDTGDPYKVLADYEAYSEDHKKIDVAYKDKSRWAKMAIINTAKMGKFTSDRAITDDVNNIWHLKPLPCKVQARPKPKSKPKPKPKVEQENH
ncbi:MAG: starch phosphorylase [Alteromonadaceae bacterium]|jgi:starch phosphorylase